MTLGEYRLGDRTYLFDEEDVPAGAELITSDVAAEQVILFADAEAARIAAEQEAADEAAAKAEQEAADQAAAEQAEKDAAEKEAADKAAAEKAAADKKANKAAAAPVNKAD